MADVPPRFDGVLETVLYYESPLDEEMERFYSDLLGLRRVTRWDDGSAYRVGSGMVLLFDRDKLPERDEPLARHGAIGPVHMCLLASGGDYDAWKARLTARGVATEHEAEWPGGARSLYFRDPAGNLLEVADRDLWPD